MKLIDAVGLKIRLGKRYAYDERRIREIFKETIDDMKIVEAIPISWIENYIQELSIRTMRDIKKMIENWRKENETN